jgi:hypothetical protein
MRGVVKGWGTQMCLLSECHSKSHCRRFAPPYIPWRESWKVLTWLLDSPTGVVIVYAPFRVPKHPMGAAQE